MADFRKAKYSGSLNLAPECGPVHIELDSVAKTATASLEDPASQYTLAGGGGSLQYVIPEQTLRVYSEYTQNVIHDVDVSGLQNGDNVVAKITLPDELPALYFGTYASNEMECITILLNGTEFQIGKFNDQWLLVYLVSGSPASLASINITVVKDF